MKSATRISFDPKYFSYIYKITYEENVYKGVIPRGERRTISKIVPAIKTKIKEDEFLWVYKRTRDAIKNNGKEYKAPSKKSEAIIIPTRKLVIFILWRGNYKNR